MYNISESYLFFFFKKGNWKGPRFQKIGKKKLQCLLSAGQHGTWSLSFQPCHHSWLSCRTLKRYSIKCYKSGAKNFINVFSEKKIYSMQIHVENTSSLHLEEWMETCVVTQNVLSKLSVLIIVYILAVTFSNCL